MPSNQFDALKRSVSFSQPEIERLFADHGIEFSDLDPLITELGKTCVETLDVEANRLIARPIIKSGETLVLLAPGAILTALRHCVACLASQRDLLDSLARALTQAVARSVSRSLDRLHWTLVMEPHFEERATVGHLTFRFDRTKLAHVVVGVRRCEKYATEVIRQPAALDPIVDDLESLLKFGKDEVARHLDEEFEIFHLVVFERLFGEAIVADVPREVKGSLALPLSAEALDVITHREMGDPLALWYYAVHSERLHRATGAMVFGPLDEFALYRDLDYSFYLSDKGRYDTVIIPSDVGAGLRHQVAAEFRPRGARAPGTTRDLHWILMHPGTEYPLYFSPEAAERPIFRLEALPLPVWITTPRKPTTAWERGLYVDLVDATLYWLWQVASSLNPAVETLRETLKYLHLLVHIVPGDAWKYADKPPDLPAISFRLLPDDTLVLAFASASLHLAHRSDNFWDRELVRCILQGFAGLLQRVAPNTGTSLDATRINEIVERHAPLGLKKIFLPVPSQLAPRLTSGKLPAVRTLQQPVTQLLLDELGEYLQTQGELIAGKSIAETDVTPLLRDHVVSFFYQRLRELVAEMDPAGLLEALVAHNEKLIQDAEKTRFLLPSRVACFGRESTAIRRYAEALQRNARASVANRFLIEYVAARPPAGTRKLDLSTYDRLLGIAHEIANWGRISDLIHYQLGAFEFRLLPSGRLGCQRGRFDETADTYTRLVYGQKAQLQLESFEDYWLVPDLKPRLKPPEARELDEATRAELGVSLTDLVDFLAFLATHCRQQGDLMTIEVVSFLKLVVAGMGWQIQTAEKALNLLSLSSRKDFLRPSNPFLGSDVYPWRFNRDLSYLRRPFLIQKGASGSEVVFGHRSLHVAYEYLVDLCKLGNLKAASSLMRSYNAKAKAVRGEEFNDLVASLLAARNHLEVHPRIKKFAGHRIVRPNGQDLGDIDVLVAIRDRRRILAIETKDLKLAKTPLEIGRELKTNFDSDNESSAISKHLERTTWLRDHLDLVLTDLGIQKRKGKLWKVEGLFVVSADLFSPYLFKPAIPVVSIRELQLDGGGGVLRLLASRRRE